MLISYVVFASNDDGTNPFAHLIALTPVFADVTVRTVAVEPLSNTTSMQPDTKGNYPQAEHTLRSM